MKMQLYALYAALAFSGFLGSVFAQDASADAKKYDFGDFTSSTLTGKAWKALNAKDFDGVLAYATKCREMFQDKAVEQQASLQAPASKDQAFTYWALNDVGTSLFILGQAYEAQGKTEKAVEAYKFLTEKLSFAQCWDPQGWFWKPADAAKTKLSALEFQTMQSK